MKILWVTKNFSSTYTGGTKISFNYIKAFNEIANVEVLCLYGENEFSKEIKFNGRLNFLKQLYKHKKVDYDYVFFDDHFSALAFLFKQKTISFYHGNWPDLMWLNPLYFIKGLYLFPSLVAGLYFSNCAIFTNPYFQKKFSSVYQHSIMVLNPVPAALQYKENNEVTGNTIKVVVVGNIDKRKYSGLLDFLKWQEQKQTSNNIEFYVYGRAANEKVVKQLQHFKVNIMGFVEKVPYYQYDFHASFSKAENTPLSMFEALKANLPCLYPKRKYYADFQNVDGILQYSNFDEFVTMALNSKKVKVDSSFIPPSYDYNVEIILKYIKNDI
jgi:hypothetical protein